MTFGRALTYFFQEAAVNLIRSLRVSLLAIFTIALSLFVGGAFWLATSNLTDQLDRWQGETQVIVYLVDDAAERPDEVTALTTLAERPAWAGPVRRVASAEAEERFRRLFPELSDVALSQADPPLPASLEIPYDPVAADEAERTAWVTELAASPAASMVDDDREWLLQLQAWIGIARAVGLVLGLALLAGAILTTASIIRLTAYIHRDEIAIMRMVGATEFFIRGPFYVEGLLQGLLGALVAVTGLWSAYGALLGRGEGLLVELLAGRFLTFGQSLTLVALGGLAGLVGAVVSLRRERPSAAVPDPGD
jgi:cell division transport system permease protein